MPVLFSGYRFQPCSVTFVEAVGLVARTISADAPPSVLAQAGDALRDALRQWAREHPWNYLRTEKAWQLLAGVDLVEIGQAFYHIYDVRWTDGTEYRTLQQLEQRDYDKVVEDQTLQDTPAFYTLNNMGDRQALKILPTPNVDGSVNVRGFRPLKQTPENEDTLDVPEHHADGLLNLARANLLAQFGGETERRNYFLQMGLAALGTAKRDDTHSPDEEIMFRPGHAMVPNRDYAKDAWQQVLDHYGY